MTTFTIENNPAGMNTVFLEVTVKNSDLELCMGLIHCNFLCVYVHLKTIFISLKWNSGLHGQV